MTELVLQFRAAGEEVIVSKALLEAYERVAALAAQDLAAGAEDRCALAEIEFYARAQAALLRARWQRALARMEAGA